MENEKGAIYNGGYGEFRIITPNQWIDTYPFKTLAHPGHEHDEQWPILQQVKMVGRNEDRSLSYAMSDNEGSGASLINSCDTCAQNPKGRKTRWQCIIYFYCE